MKYFSNLWQLILKMSEERKLSSFNKTNNTLLFNNKGMAAKNKFALKVLQYIEQHPNINNKQEFKKLVESHYNYSISEFFNTNNEAVKCLDEDVKSTKFFDLIYKENPMLSNIVRSSEYKLIFNKFNNNKVICESTVKNCGPIAQQKVDGIQKIINIYQEIATVKKAIVQLQQKSLGQLLFGVVDQGNTKKIEDNTEKISALKKQVETAVKEVVLNPKITSDGFEELRGDINNLNMKARSLDDWDIKTSKTFSRLELPSNRAKFPVRE